MKEKMNSEVKGIKKQFINSHSKLVKEAAEKKGVQFKALIPSLFLYQLSFKERSNLFCEGLADLTPAPAYIAADRKNLSYKFLKKWDIPIPEAIVAHNFEESFNFLKKYKKIVIKPLNLAWGLGITAGVSDENVLKDAIDHVHKYVKVGGGFLAQEFLEGEDHRVLVIGYKKIFCLQRNPASLVGDGKTKIKDLIKNKKIRTGSAEKFLEAPKDKLLIALKTQDLDMGSIPEKGREVKLNTTANIHFGGFSVDKTNVVCEEAKVLAKKVARKFAMPVLGIDFISSDISKTPGKIIELNPAPDLMMHTNPDFGKSYNPAEALIDFLFFSGEEEDLKLRPELN